MQIINISRRLEKGTPTWPGDTPFSYEVSWPKELSGSVNVGKLTMSIHTGTHVDAPFHFDSEGKRINDLDLNIYIGRAMVIDLPDKKSIGTEELAAFDFKGCERLLLRTGSWKDPSVFPDLITILNPDLGPFLEEKGVRLIGVDVPSVDPLESKELSAHHSLNRHGIHILEGLDLSMVLQGEYELVALPLPLAEADGSPVRAILRKYE
ncbi:arylformamidase [Neobacillus terrae]|uniref:arylformamidase n=1 Tax=Neobacillus terrae TaxID=3034837 RepID=UPI00140C5853|nr:arylformamidase [Neobacillus terrae]